MLITRKRIVLTIGIGCILWGYYQLFAVDADKSLINKQVTALTEKVGSPKNREIFWGEGGEVRGKVVAIKANTVIIAHKDGIAEVPKVGVIKIDGLQVNDYEIRRVLHAVGITTLGGILIWIALFFL